MRICVGIPARMGSSRFPGKPLANICGMPMIEHIYKRCLLAEDIDEIFIATCDDIIKDTVSEFGGTVIMTDPNIPRPGLRVAEAAKSLDLDDNDIVMGVQGDEPLIHPDLINLCFRPLIDENDPKNLLKKINESDISFIFP